MILQNQKQAIVLGDESDSSTLMSLDMESAQILMSMLSKDLYSDPIGSTVREVASNALDSHRNKGVTDPIIVTLTKYNGKLSFIVEDFGGGLDDNDVINVISKYGKSTKRNSTTELGMMGLGFKSPLAYTSSFYFETIKNGMFRTYMMYEGENGNQIDLLVEKPNEIEKESGVKVIVPVQSSDFSDFFSAIKEQLAYFETVVWSVDFDYNRKTSESVRIYRHELFQWSSTSDNSLMHLTLDNVYYPIDYKKLGIKEIYVPIALRFSLTDGIYPTPNRENIKYTPETVELIKNKIRKVTEWFVNRWNEDIAELFEDITEVYAELTSRTPRVEISSDSITKLFTVNLVSLPHEFKPIVNEPKLKGVELLNPTQLSGNSALLMKGYMPTYEVKNGSIRRFTKSYEHNWSSYGTMLGLSGYNHVVLVPSTFTGKMKAYIKSKHYNNVLIVSKLDNESEEYTFSDLRHLTYKFPAYNENKKQVIKDFLYMRKLVFKKFEDLVDFDFPEEFIKRYKAQYQSRGGGQRADSSSGEVSVKRAAKLQMSLTDRYCKFEPSIFNTNANFHGLCVYGLHEDQAHIEQVYGLFSQKYRPKFITVSSKFIKKLDQLEIHNLIKFEDFMKGKSRRLFALATALYIRENITEKYSLNVDNFKNTDLVLATKYEMLLKYVEKHLKDRWSANTTVAKIIVDYAEENNLYDNKIMYLVREVEKTFKKLYFLQEYQQIRNLDNSRKILRDLYTYHKHRGNLSLYQKQTSTK